MVKKYIYLVDEFNRIVNIHDYNEVTAKHYTSERGYLEGDFEESKVNDIKFGYDGIVDGDIQYIGLTEEEKEYQEKSFTTERLQTLKQLLQDTDGKVIVNHELKSLNKNPKYDEEELHNQRQSGRDEINLLEQTL